MRDKFDKYWDGLLNMNLLVIIASVFDPQNKMQFASLCFEQLYGKDTVESTKIHNSVTKVIKELYKEYSAKLGKPLESQDSCGTSYSEQQVPICEFSDDEDDCEGIQTMYDKMVGSSTTAGGCSELDVYLTEKTEMRMENSLGMTFDVLSWWKHNSSKFPILSELARDVLAIQFSLVASESVFSTSGRVLDPYRSSLTPYLVEVLLCTQQWLRYSFKSEAQAVNIVQMLEEVEFF